MGKKTSLSGTLVFDSARCARLPGNELKIDCLGLLFIYPYGRLSTLKQMFCSSEEFFHCHSMQRFVSKRSSSSVDLDSSSPPSPCLLVLVGHQSSGGGRSSWQRLWERALQEHMLPQGVRLQRPDWWRPGETIALPQTHEEIAHVSTPCAPPPPTPAAAHAEDKPSGSAAKRRKVNVDPFVRDWFVDMSCHWKTERQRGIPQCLGEVRRLCPGMFDGINQNIPYRWKKSAPRAAPLGRKTLLSPADMIRLSEYIMRVSDVLCPSEVTIRGLVHDWLDAAGLDVRSSKLASGGSSSSCGACGWATRSPPSA